MSDEEAQMIREDAVAYADRVMAGEKPWEDEEEGGDVATADESTEEDGDGEKNEDVGETESDAPEVIEVEQPTE